MKTLNFDTKEKYEILYEGLSSTEYPYRARDTVLLARIFDKIEAIGHKKSENEKGFTISGRPNPDDFEATGTGPSVLYPSVELEDEEFSLVLRAFDAVGWTSAGARAASKVYDWLHSIK